MKNRKDPENEPAFTNKKRKKHFTPYKKDKYSISKLEEYEKLFGYKAITYIVQPDQGVQVIWKN